MPAPGRTPDGRHIVVHGRKWRATDPGIPEKLRAELVKALMNGRRGVKTTSPSERLVARRRVNDAKVALGERGDPWWAPTPEGKARRIDAAVCALCRQRAPSTICPSEVSRVIRGDATEAWRAEMEPIRERARRLARSGVVDVCQKGERIDPEGEFRGPIRLRAAERIDEPREGDEEEASEGGEDGEGGSGEEEDEKDEKEEEEDAKAESNEEEKAAKDEPTKKEADTKETKGAAGKRKPEDRPLRRSTRQRRPAR